MEAKRIVGRPAAQAGVVRGRAAPSGQRAFSAAIARKRRARRFGVYAEDLVARRYRAAGAILRALRERTPYGEIDLIFERNEALIFVEVKARRAIEVARESISQRQWKRLAEAATHYMAGVEGAHRWNARFDAAFVGADGAVEIVDNAHSFDEW